MTRAEGPRHPTVLLVLAYLGFISLGLPDAILGVSWPAMRGDFGQPAGRVGLVVLVSTSAYLLSSLNLATALARFGLGRLLTLASGLMATALTLIGLAPAFILVLVAALVLGTGQASIDGGLNAYAARHFSARHMNWLHASFGFGAAAGPLVVTATLGLGLGWRVGYGVVAVALAALAVAFGLTAGTWRRNGARAGGSGRDKGGGAGDGDEGGRAPPPAIAPARVTLRLPAVWFSAAAFVVYVGVELGAGIWAYTLLTEGRGVAETTAGLAVAAYWGGLFVGRLVAGVVTDTLGVHRVLAGGIAGMTVAVGLIALPTGSWTAMVGLVLLGLSAAPVFPLFMLTTGERMASEHVDRTVGVQAGSAAIGAAVLVAGIGAVVERFGPDAIGPCLLVLSLLLAALYTFRLRPRY